jgi:hypothetical protein
MLRFQMTINRHREQEHRQSLWAGRRELTHAGSSPGASLGSAIHGQAKIERYENEIGMEADAGFEVLVLWPS